MCGRHALLPGQAHSEEIVGGFTISFGLQSFAIILIKRAYQVVKTDDLDEMNTIEEDYK